MRKGKTTFGMGVNFDPAIGGQYVIRTVNWGYMGHTNRAIFNKRQSF